MENQVVVGTDPAVVLAAIASAPKRFRGRAALVAAASAPARQVSWGGDLVEAVRSEALRLLSLSDRAREIAALREECSSDFARELLSAADRKRVAQKREERRRALLIGRDQLASRTPGNVAERTIRAAVKAALREVGFRRATHDHTSTISIVTEGHESARSTTGAISPRDAGLPSSYAKHAYSVTTSSHAWDVSRAVLDVPRERRVVDGCLYLSPVVRVRQGRGTSLVVERASVGRGGRQVWA